MSGELTNILSQVNKLNKADQTLLLKKLASIVKENKLPVETLNLNQITGLGSSVWTGVDIDNYIDTERQW